MRRPDGGVDEWDVETRVTFRHQTRGCGICLHSPFLVRVFIASDWWFGGTFAPFVPACFLAFHPDLLASAIRLTKAPKSVRTSCSHFSSATENTLQIINMHISPLLLCVFLCNSNAVLCFQNQCKNESPSHSRHHAT